MKSNKQVKRKLSKKNPENDIFKENKTLFQKKEFSFTKRLIINILLFVIFFTICLLLSFQLFDYQDPTSIQYTENQNIDYKVYLKPNDFYEEKYLDKNMLYVASLIDYIDIDFNYKFKIEEKTTLDFNYQIIGNLVIANELGTSKYFEKEYVLLDTKNTNIINSDTKSIQENIKIDYQHYNELANNFKNQYGVDTSSYLNIYLKINKNSDDESNVTLNDTSSSSITIPLSEKAISIGFDAKDTNSVKNVLTNRKIILHSNILILEIILFVLSLLLLIKLIKLVIILPKPKTSYDKFLKRILKEYDRMIVETTTPYNIEDCHIIEIHKFEELLDVRDNLKVPIMYYNISDHQKCYFYIKNQQDVYLFKLKAIDMEENSENS